MSNYVSLSEALEGYFDKPLKEMSDALRRRVATAISPIQWDACSPDFRRKIAIQLDTPPESATTEDEQQFLEELLERKNELEQELLILNKIPNPSVSEYVLKKSKKTEATREIDQIELQLSQARGDYLEVDGSAAASSLCQSVDAAQIILNFLVARDEDKNKNWWKSRLSDPKRYKLLECRHGDGKKGRGARTLWWPDQIAEWLVDRKIKGHDGLSIPDARKALKKFPGYAEVADDLFPPDE